MIRYRIHFSGRVQGVGFRYTAMHIATGFEVTGFVKNLPDGRVLIVAEGRKNELDAFVSEIHRRMAGYVHRHTTGESEATGEFAASGKGSFDVRY